jgi:Mn-dependent DtxR family transcriptional regulator
VGPQENGRRQKILAVLADAPLATREIAQAIHVDRKLTKMALQRMAKVGLIKGVGAGPGRRWTRAGKPAKEAP